MSACRRYDGVCGCGCGRSAVRLSGRHNISAEKYQSQHRPLESWWVSFTPDEVYYGGEKLKVVSRTKLLVAVASICRCWRSLGRCCAVVDVGTNDGGVVRRGCQGEFGGLLSLLLALTRGLCSRFCRALLRY